MRHHPAIRIRRHAMRIQRLRRPTVLEIGRWQRDRVTGHHDRTTDRESHTPETEN